MIESSITIHNHIDSIAHIDDWEFNWSVYEWEKAIPDFEWSKGHSGTLLSDAQA